MKGSEKEREREREERRGGGEYIHGVYVVYVTVGSSTSFHI